MSKKSSPIAVESVLARYLMHLLSLAALIIFLLAYSFADPGTSLGEGKWLFACSVIVTILLSCQLKHAVRFEFLYQCLGLIVFNTACYLTGINQSMAQLIVVGAVVAGFIHLLLVYVANNEQQRVD